LETPCGLGFAQEIGLERGELFRFLRREIVGLGEILAQVEQLPRVLFLVPVLEGQRGGGGIQGISGPKVAAYQPFS